jgi:hypothetical protein
MVSSTSIITRRLSSSLHPIKEAAADACKKPCILMHKDWGCTIPIVSLNIPAPDRRYDDRGGIQVRAGKDFNFKYWSTGLESSDAENTRISRRGIVRPAGWARW